MSQSAVLDPCCGSRMMWFDQHDPRCLFGDMRQGFAECFRVLKPNGVLQFKWNETQVPLREILACSEEKPLYGQKMGRHNRTHWMTFMKAGDHA